MKFRLGVIFSFAVILSAADLSAQAFSRPEMTNQVEYYRELDKSDSLIYSIYFEPPMLVIFSDDELGKYGEITTLDGRKQFIRNYWENENPAPLLEENLWLKEFIERCNFTMENFSMRDYPFFDDRGRYYIKMGEPYIRITDRGGYRKAKFLNDDFTYGTIYLMYDRNPPLKNYSVKANESWSYRDGVQELVLHFVREGEFREVPSLDYALNTRQERNRIWYWMDMIKDRFNLSPRTADIVKEIDAFEIEIIKISNGRSNLPNVGSGLKPHAGIMREKQSEEMRLRTIKHFMSPYMSNELRNLNNIGFSADMAYFKGSSGMTRVYTFLYPDLDSFSDLPDSIGLHLQYSAVFRNNQQENPAIVRESQDVSASFRNEENNKVAVYPLVNETPPGINDVSLQISESNSILLGFIGKETEIRDFNSNSLMVSDIVFLVPDEHYSEGTEFPVPYTDAGKFSPYPYTEISREIPLVLYFEIYNLIEGGTGGRVKVEVTASAAGGGRNPIKRIGRLFRRGGNSSTGISYERSSENNDLKELITLDVSSLKKGTYKLEITVTPERNKNLTARTDRDFKIYR